MCHGVRTPVGQAMCFGLKYSKLVEIYLTDWSISWPKNTSINGNACKETSKA